MNLKNKKVLVTGADGFIGSHLVERLIEEGAKVRAFCCYNSFGTYGWIDSFSSDVRDEVEVLLGDIRDAGSVRTAVKDMDVVFHLAALIAIPYSYYSPESYVDTNIKGTLNVLQACRDYNVERIFVTSTSEVYGTALYVPIDELHPKQGQSPYSATKIGADHMAESFFRSFQSPVTIVRPFNTYGPRQSARAVIPTIITQLLSGKKEIKLGALHPTRDLVFVKDTVNGFVAIAQSDKTLGEEVNIATNAEISVGDLAQKIIKLTNTQAEILSDDMRLRPEKSEVNRLLGSNKKITSLTTWTPQSSLDQGLMQTIEWFSQSSNLSRYKANVYNI
jgi:NAD dependent epimerase/dehydratase